MSTTRTWRQRVLDADPDFLGIDNTRPVVYEFCCRKFRQPLDPYGSFPRALLAEDGTPILGEDGTIIEVESA